MEIPDWVLLKEHLMKEGRLTKKDLIQLILNVTEIMSILTILTLLEKEPNVLIVEEPAVIVGDIHG